MKNILTQSIQNNNVPCAVSCWDDANGISDIAAASLPSTFLEPNWQPTQKFNGYGEFVADLYKDMDLARNY